MSNNGKIYIVVTDKLPGGVGPGPSPTPTTPNNEEDSNDPNSLLGHWARSRLLATAKQLALKTVHYSFANIGNFTGDYIAQRNVNNALSTLSSFKNIGANAMAGLTVAGPVGAVIGASIGVINETASSVFEIISRRIETNKTNYEIQQLTKRAGLNSTYDGSRGTEN